MELREACDLSLHEYEVLLLLSEAPGQRMRMSDVASAVLLSQSGLTRLVDRLAQAGAVERTRCLEDRRGLNAELTEAGRARLERARPTHLHGVRARFLTTSPPVSSRPWPASGNGSPPAPPRSE